jgi:hypothetical protein
MVFESFIKNSDLKIKPKEKYEIVISTAKDVMKRRSKRFSYRFPYSSFLRKLVKNYNKYCREKGVESICNIDIMRAAVAAGLAYHISKTGKVESLENHDYLLSNLVNMYIPLVKKDEKKHELRKLSSYIRRNKERILDSLI